MSGLTLVAFAVMTVAAAPAAVLNDQYPKEALRNREQGVVLVDLTVGVDGRVSNCVELINPNSAALANATCEAFTTRGNFKPAKDSLGRPYASKVRAKITWVIPGCRAPTQKDPRLNAEVSVAGVVTSSQRCRAN